MSDKNDPYAVTVLRGNVIVDRISRGRCLLLVLYLTTMKLLVEVFPLAMYLSGDILSQGRCLLLVLCLTTMKLLVEVFPLAMYLSGDILSQGRCLLLVLCLTTMKLLVEVFPLAMYLSGDILFLQKEQIGWPPSTRLYIMTANDKILADFFKF